MKSFGASLAITAALVFAPALAQDAQQQKAPKVTDEKTVGDWTIRCYDIKAPTPCEMVEMQVAKKTGQRVLSVLFAYAPESKAHVMQIAVPLGVVFENGLVISADNWKSPVAKFRRCDQGGCYIEAAVGDDVINNLAKASKAQVQIVLIDGKRYDLKFSLKGFNDAHSTLVSLAKSKAAGTPAPAASE